MCRRALHGVVVALALCLTTPLAAQRGASAQARTQESVLDSLMARWREAMHALKAYDDSAARRRAVTDTLRAGSLRVLVEPAVRGLAELAVRAAAARVDSIAGTAARRLENRWLVVHKERETSGDTMVVAALDHNGIEFMHVWGAANDTLLTRWLVADALQLLSSSMDFDARQWMGGDFLPDTVTTSAWLSTRLDVVSSYAVVSRRCYDGNLLACKIALRLVAVEDPVRDWYDGPGRRQLVWSTSSHQNMPDEDAARCIAGVDDSCMHWMRRGWRFGDPLPPYRRRTLAAVAIRMGGRAGYERLLSATGPISDRLAAAAGVPIDSVLRVWLGQVRDTRRPSQDMTTGIAGASLGWILLVGVLALRSTRWR